VTSEPWVLIDADGPAPRESPLAVSRSGGELRAAPEAVASALGWTLEAEGLCRGDVCVPVRDRGALLRDGGIDLERLAALLGRPLACDAEERMAVLGVSAEDRARALMSLEAPDFTLPDLSGQQHSLHQHRGKKVLLIAYASW
jgi:hypothetical protein